MKVVLLNPPWPGTGIGTRSQNRIIKKNTLKKAEAAWPSIQHKAVKDL